ncbi:hypothetical protein OM416_03610 [Paenibacillus sp. LS1]|uniref:hypothetical protein n=1 Tax=Paenibacillus sp. LS1 TaxID=2992120 RepID=UPI00222FB2BD|nr:hypothetical protein [Paenibacillus sp. LS1]MCW3790652.1 hypothetical protein [Paenibacillus sp. LS1]
MKKALLLLSALMLTIAITACGSETEKKAGTAPVKSNETELAGTPVPEVEDTEQTKEETKQEEVAEPVEAIEYEFDGLKISEVSVKDDNGMWSLTASIENTDKEFEVALLKVTINDKGGKQIGTADGTVDFLGKGESKTVEFYSMDDLTGYDSFKFQIDNKM